MLTSLKCDEFFNENFVFQQEIPICGKKDIKGGFQQHINDHNYA